MKKLRGLLCAMVLVVGTVGVSTTGWGATFIIVTPPDVLDTRIVCVESNLYQAAEQLAALGGMEQNIVVEASVLEGSACADFGF